MIIRPKISDRTRLSALFANRPTKTRGLSMPEFAETTVVTAGPRKGEKFQLANAEYLRRPMELASPESSNRLNILMFPAQSGKSAYLQIFHGYYAKEYPSEGLYVTSDLKQAKKAMERRFEPLFKSINVEFRTQSENKSSRRTGDVTFSKEFDGGNLDIATKNSSGDLASETKKTGSYDEIDRGKEILGVEGSSWDQFEARFNAWLGDAKLNVASTPTDIEISAIWYLYLTGTEEEWLMNCPLCGKHQILTTKKSDGYGLDYDTKSGNVIESSVSYICQHCARSFKEIHKFDMLQNGIWQVREGATAPIDDYTSSFHITALNSMFYSWFMVAKKYEQGLDSLEKKKTFENLVMGMPFKESGSRPKAEKVRENNKGNYASRTVPDGVIYLASSTDVQAGANRHNEKTDEQLEADIVEAIANETAHEKKFPRLEYLVIGKGPGYRTWSIDYQVFYGRTDYAFSGAWEKLNDYKQQIEKENGFYGYIRQRDAMQFPIVTTLIDGGNKPDVSYQFSQRWSNTFICKGAKEIPLPTNIKNISLSADNYLDYRPRKSSAVTGAVFYEIGTKKYKQKIYGSLRIQRIDSDVQPPAFRDFPHDFPDRFFDGLTSEELVKSTGNYDNAGRWNDPLDITVYAECAADIYLDVITKKTQEGYKKQGIMTQAQIDKIDKRYMILLLSERMRIDKRYNDAPIRTRA